MSNKRYFAKVQNYGSLAVEKYLNDYIKEKYDNCIIAEDRVESVIADIKTKQEEYFSNRRGKRIEIEFYLYKYTNTQRISVGSISISLIQVKEFYI